MSLNDIIMLNVGGTRFQTTRQTLVKDPESMLGKMFAPDSKLKPGIQQDGAYFLDRDPTYFRLILNYLRTGVLLAETHQELQAVLCEAKFFSIISLEEQIMQKLEPETNVETPESDEYRINVGGRIFVTTKETLCRCAHSKLADLVEGRIKPTLDSQGLIFIDEDPEDFQYILRALRNSTSVTTAVPQESIDNVLNLRDNLEIREIKFGYRQEASSFVSEYCLSLSR